MKKHLVVMLVCTAFLLLPGVATAAKVIPATAYTAYSKPAAEFTYSEDFYDLNFPSWNYLIRATMAKYSGNTSIYYW